MSQDLTTLICLFHHKDQAQSALQDILKADVPESNVTVIGGAGSNIASSRTSLAELNVPEHDLKHLLEGLKDQGVVLTVSTISNHVEAVEEIFSRYKAGKIDEAVVADDMSSRALPISNGGQAIPIVEEELQVGKRTVDAGGVRVYRRIVEIPVEESVRLREEHVSVTRQAVDRPVTDADLRLQGTHVIELTETAEEAVIGKSARVVEEVVVGKSVTERTERIQDTIRRTEVEVEEFAPAAGSASSDRV